MGKRRGRKMEATATKLVPFTTTYKRNKTSRQKQKNRPVPFHEMSKKDQKETMEAMRED